MTSSAARPPEPQEDDRPLSPAESLALIETERDRLIGKIGPDPSLLYLAFGVAYVAIFGSVYLTLGPVRLLPDWLTLTIGIVVGVAAVGSSIALGVRAGRGLVGPSQKAGAMYGCSWTLGFAALVGVNTQFSDAGLPYGTVSLIWSGSALVLVGVLFLAGGAMFGDVPQYVLGIWILVTAVLAVLVGYPSNFLMLALAGGGGLLAASVCSRMLFGKSRRA